MAAVILACWLVRRDGLDRNMKGKLINSITGRKKVLMQFKVAYRTFYVLYIDISFRLKKILHGVGHRNHF